MDKKPKPADVKTPSPKTKQKDGSSNAARFTDQRGRVALSGLAAMMKKTQT